MVAGIFLVTTLLCFTAANSLPLIQPSDEVCQTLSTSCQDLWIASGCKKVKTCISEVWEKLEVPLDNSNVCNICKEMVKEARDQLLSNETQEELKEVLEGSCNLIPVGFISKMCRQVVDSLIPDLIDMLVSRMDPNQVCSISGLCNPDFMTQGLQSKLQQSLLLSSFQSRVFLPSSEASTSVVATKKSSDCVLCKDAMKYSKKMFNKISEERMTSIVLKACENRLGNQSPECQAIAKVFLPPVFKFLRTMNPDAFCAHLKHCTLVGSTKLEVPVFAKANDDLTCDFCKQLVEHLRQILASNATQEELKEAFLNFCEELGSAAEECQKLLDEYFDMAYSYLLEALTPDEFCAAIGLCQQTSRGGMNSQEKAMNKVIMKLFPSSEQQKKHLLKLKLKKYGKVGPSYKSVQSMPLVKVVPALPAKYLEANTSAALPMVKLFPSQKTKAGDIITCSLCKSLINLAEQLLPGNMTVEAIADLLDYICDLFPASEEQQCKAFIDTNRDIIIKFLTEDAAPEVICHMITLCSAPPAPRVSPYSDCDFCQDIVQFLYSELKNNSTEEELGQLLEGVCRLFPGESEKKCLGVVDTYFNLVMSMILQEFTPDQICKQLGFCPSSKQAPSSIHAIPQPTKQVINQKVSDSECDMCVNVVQFVYSELKDNATEEEIKLLLDKACSLFSGETRQKCVNMVNTYFDMLVSLLTQQLSPDQICQAMGFCASSKQVLSVHPGPLPEGHTKKDKSGSECDMCITVVQYVYSQLKNESTEEEIKEFLDQACSFFPEESRQKCVNMVNTYLDIIVSLLIQQTTPTQLCQIVGFCPNSKKMPSSVHPVPQPKAHIVKSRSGAECDICINVVQFVYSELKDNATEEEIKQLLDKACSLLPGSSKQKCIDMVNNYLDMLVALIIQQLSPDEICQTLGFCPSSIAASPVVTSASHFSKQGIPKVTFGGECEICKNVVQFVYNEMKDKSSEEEVKKLLDGVCNLFAETERQECVTLVNTYLDVLVPMLLNKYTPTQICQSLHLCPNARATSLPSAPKNVSPKKMADPDPECEFCQSIVKLVHDELKDEKTEAAVKKALDHVCDLCPSRQKCITFVNTYYERLVSLLLQEMDPNLICKDFLHLCSEGLRGNFECTFCNYALHFIQNQLVDNVTEARVQEVLDKLCDELPEQFADECRAFVEAGRPRAVSKEGQVLTLADVVTKSVGTLLLFDVVVPVVTFRYIPDEDGETDEFCKSDGEVEEEKGREAEGRPEAVDRKEQSEPVTTAESPTSEEQETTHPRETESSASKDPSYQNNLNSWLGQVLNRDVPRAALDLLDLDQHGVCLRFCPLESAHVFGTMTQDVEELHGCLLKQLAILNATVRQKRKFRRALEHHENLALVEVCHWAGLGGVRYIPGPWLGQPLDEAGREDINHLNSELVLKLKSTDSAFSLGEGDDGMCCVRFGMVTDDLDVEELVGLVLAAGMELEESSKALESMSELVKQGIQEASKGLQQENEEKIMQEGLLRHVPIVGSLFNWWSPTSKESGIWGRSFNITSGLVESTENIYKYHMQIQQGGSPALSNCPPQAQVLVQAGSPLEPKHH